VLRTAVRTAAAVAVRLAMMRPFDCAVALAVPLGFALAHFAWGHAHQRRRRDVGTMTDARHTREARHTTDARPTRPAYARQRGPGGGASPHKRSASAPPRRKA